MNANGTTASEAPPRVEGPKAAKPTLTLTISETAHELRVCRNTVYSLIRRKLLHVCRIGQRLRVRRVELERYLEWQQKVLDHQSRVR